MIEIIVPSPRRLCFIIFDLLVGWLVGRLIRRVINFNEIAVRGTPRDTKQSIQS